MFTLTIFGCNRKIYHWEFNHSCEEISQMMIVEMTNDLNFQEIQEIDISLAEKVYNDVINLEMKRYGTNLSSPYGMCLLIVFKNGEYDIISRRESKHFKYCDGKILPYNSWLYCDGNEFDKLINKYLTNR